MLVNTETTAMPVQRWRARPDYPGEPGFPGRVPPQLTLVRIWKSLVMGWGFSHLEAGGEGQGVRGRWA